MNRFFTSESVGMGHPDKVCDQISDAVLQECLDQDKDSRVACEATATEQFVLVSGEIRTKARLNVEKLVRDTVAVIGYRDPALGFDYKNMQVLVKLKQQSQDIARGVDTSGSKEQGAGDQGMMFGYASTETEQYHQAIGEDPLHEYMPLPIMLAHKLVEKTGEVQGIGDPQTFVEWSGGEPPEDPFRVLPYLRPDCKSQVTVEYDEQGNPLRIDSVVISAMHTEDVSQEQIERDIREKVIDVICGRFCDDHTVYHINPTGRFVEGGPKADTGLTGRKIIVDTYGGMGRHGGGAFSGKDPSKVDRTGAYMTRWVAKNIVAAGLADRCEVQVSYAIGKADPTSILVDTFGTAKVPEAKIAEAVRKTFDFRPGSIVRDLDLTNARFTLLSAFGHMGRMDLQNSWEKTNRTEDLRAAVR